MVVWRLSHHRRYVAIRKLAIASASPAVLILLLLGAPWKHQTSETVTKRSKRPGSTFAVAILLYHSQHPTLPDHTARDGELFSEMLRHGFSTTPRAFILKSDHFRYLRGPV